MQTTIIRSVGERYGAALRGAVLVLAGLVALGMADQHPHASSVLRWGGGALSALGLAWAVFGSFSFAQRHPHRFEWRVLYSEEQPEPVRQLMDVESATEENGIKIFRGTLRDSAANVYEKLKRAFAGQTVPLVQEDEQLGVSITLIPQDEEEEVVRSTRVWLHWSLFFLTFLTTMWVSALQQGVNLLDEPWRFMVGLPYSLGLLGILGVHELGHYYMAKRHGMQVTPPYFIPIPFALGTFGAFIQMRSPAENRRMLFDIAVAGPLAGLAVAIPALYFGLKSSMVLVADMGESVPVLGEAIFGSSLLFALISKLSLGETLHMEHLVRLSPLAFAGWLGLIVTALNLLPIGQLDGGHIVRAMFGRRIGNAISKTTMWTLLFAAVFIWHNLILWALIVFLIAGKGAPPLNDVTVLTPGRRRLGYLAFLILASILLPLPGMVG